MSRGWKIVVWAGGAAWAALALAATIPAHQAISNLQSWAEVLGLTTLGQLFAAKGVDYLVQLGAFVLATMATLMWHYTMDSIKEAKKIDAEQVLRIKRQLEEALRRKSD